MRSLNIATNSCLCPEFGYYDDGSVECKCTT